MSPIEVEQVRRALQTALVDTDSPDLTAELLDMMISAAVERELQRRADRRWKRLQQAGWLTAPFAGLAVIWRFLSG
ncbi:MAG: hypothetical protein OXG35_24890 [Acidobacteria bacterium]|nr:hypothetical protein [Acidobacteriota bacterium]